MQKVLHKSVDLNNDVESNVLPNSGKNYAASSASSDGPQELEADENLGEDFDSTPWLPPSIDLAKKYKRDNIFRYIEMKFQWITKLCFPSSQLEQKILAERLNFAQGCHTDFPRVHLV